MGGSSCTASIIADTQKLNYWNGDDNLDNNMLFAGAH